MAMGADYSFELIFNETCAPQFNGHNNSFLASVWSWLFKNQETQYKTLTTPEMASMGALNSYSKGSWALLKLEQVLGL